MIKKSSHLLQPKEPHEPGSAHSPIAIGNVTFIIHPEDANLFTGWLLKHHCFLKEIEAKHRGQNLRLAKVASIPGDTDFGEQAASYSLQMEFLSLESAAYWTSELIEFTADDFAKTFSSEALTFPSILDIIPL